MISDQWPDVNRLPPTAMSRISSSISGIERSLLNRLSQANAAIALSTLRKASGHKITSPGADPSAFIQLSSLQTQLTQTTKALANATAAGNLVGEAQSALTGISDQLQLVRDALLNDGGSLSPAQQQAQIDQAIEAIDSLAQTRIGGRQVLSGGADFQVANVNSEQVASVSVYATGGGTRSIYANVTQAATQAELAYQGTNDDKIVATASFTLAGAKGDATISVTAGQTLATAASTINQQSHLTGVTAAVDTPTHQLQFTSVDYGSAATASVTVLSGAFDMVGAVTSDTGSDAQATINNVAYTGTGNIFAVSDNGFRYSIEFTGGFSGTTSTMSVSGNALTFALSPDLTLPTTVSIPDMHAARLGGVGGRLTDLASGGSLSIASGRTSEAIRVVDGAISQAAIVQGNVGGFQKTAVDTASNFLSDLEIELTDAIADIDGVDDTEEDTLIARQEALASNSLTGLMLLTQQRQTVVYMLQHLAGLA